MNFFNGDYLYFQWETADDIYFIKNGKVKLLYDLMKGEAEPYMIPFNMYVEGSYFGDNDVLKDVKKKGRDGTALV